MAHFISIIIPAFNAEQTIARTLASAQQQGGVEFEIIVVDDGSSDRTADIVAQIADRDRRIILLTQSNGGVARARNLALDQARGDLIAPLDADDLWHPEKLLRQTRCLEEQSRDVGLVYNWFRRIDQDDMVIPGSPRPMVEGQVFHRHLAWNFISNGSTPLIRREHLGSLAYEPFLRDEGLQGCEDYLLQLQLARRARFACVPAFLTGYRRTPGAMSSHVERMIRSHIAMFKIVASQIEGTASPVIQQQLSRLHVEWARNSFGKMNAVGTIRNLGSAMKHDRGGAARSLKTEIIRTVRGRARYPASSARSFASFEADEIDGPWIATRSMAVLGQLAAMDEEITSGLPDGPGPEETLAF
ncbi:glycosyltransferase family 2 protein [Sphingobium limneticum]|uniref:glycosyltransferase family 2 protein n=1 Tax=Sphingobium limneticum TaxID=1007511 RepID=UPI00123D570F|nr:glycosyltransferase family A protein [Sphingobium limneticum]KAA9013037.1 glycosyltransferase family 2 protein [Sphingobium limneticum]